MFKKITLGLSVTLFTTLIAGGASGLALGSDRDLQFARPL